MDLLKEIILKSLKNYLFVNKSQFTLVLKVLKFNHNKNQIIALPNKSVNAYYWQGFKQKSENDPIISSFEGIGK